MKTPSDRQKAREIADRLQADQEHKDGDFTDWFEELYAGARQNAALIPWGDEKPHTGLVQWVMQNPSKPGAKAIDVGCGLGDNAAFLAASGWDVMGIDLSKSAIEWASRRFVRAGMVFRRENLFELPDDLLGRFDLVHETYTLQALPKHLSSKLFPAIASLLAPDGRLLVICRSRGEDVEPGGPPWPLAKSELDRFLKLGLEQVSFGSFEELKPDGRLIPHFKVEYKKTC
jgi:SAM-dependent methyltransferase